MPRIFHAGTRNDVLLRWDCFVPRTSHADTRNDEYHRHCEHQRRVLVEGRSSLLSLGLRSMRLLRPHTHPAQVLAMTCYFDGIASCRAPPWQVLAMTCYFDGIASCRALPWQVLAMTCYFEEIASCRAPPWQVLAMTNTTVTASTSVGFCRGAKQSAKDWPSQKEIASSTHASRPGTRNDALL